MTSPLARVEGRTDATLARLRELQAERALLVQLMETSCLFELARLQTTELDLASYLQLACDAVTQFFPVAGCAASIRVADVPDLRVVSGAPPEPGSAETHELRIGDQRVGSLEVGHFPEELRPTEFFVNVATQLSAGVGAVIESERLRRRAAAGAAHKLAAAIDERDPVVQLDALVRALAALRGVQAAELVVEHAATGSCRTAAGFWDVDGANEEAVRTTREHASPEGTLTLHLHGAAAIDPSEVAVADEVLAVAGDALDRVARTRRLVEEIETDPLTGLGNRRRFDRSLRALLSRADRDAHSVALLLIDLDHFKTVNDTHGHEVGDRVLLAAAAGLRDGVRDHDEAIRFGGDELAVVAPGCDGFGAHRIADAVRDAVAQRSTHVLPDGSVQTCSIGIAVYPDLARDRDELVRRADEALYVAKSAGRDGVAVAPPLPDADDGSEAEPGPGARRGVLGRLLHRQRKISAR